MYERDVNGDVHYSIKLGQSRCIHCGESVSRLDDDGWCDACNRGDAEYEYHLQRMHPDSVRAMREESARLRAHIEAREAKRGDAA